MDKAEITRRLAKMRDFLTKNLHRAGDRTGIERDIQALNLAIEAVEKDA